MRKLMAIFAHPDDEGAMSGTLAHYAQNDTEVILVCGTRGEVGEISDPALATPETLGEVRTRELETACEVLGIRHLEFLDYRDSGMQGTPPNEDPRALVQADPDAIRGQIADLIRKYQPEVVVTFEPFGWYGHPDHIAVAKWATEAYEMVAQDADWQPQRLFHCVIPFSKFSAMIEQAVAAGLMDPPDFANGIPEEQQAKTEAAVTHILAIGDQFEKKQGSMLAHATQFGEDSFFRKIPPEMMLELWGSEHFIQVMPKVDGSGVISAELFA